MHNGGERCSIRISLMYAHICMYMCMLVASKLSTTNDRKARVVVGPFGLDMQFADQLKRRLKHFRLVRNHISSLLVVLVHVPEFALRGELTGAQTSIKGTPSATLPKTLPHVIKLHLVSSGAAKNFDDLRDPEVLLHNRRPLAEIRLSSRAQARWKRAAVSGTRSPSSF